MVTFNSVRQVRVGGMMIGARSREEAPERGGNKAGRVAVTKAAQKIIHMTSGAYDMHNQSR